VQRRIFSAALITAVALATTTLVVFAWVFTLGFEVLEPFGDFRSHNRLAREMAAGQPLAVPHPLYHMLVVAMSAAVPALAGPGAGLAVALGAEVALALVIWSELRKAAGGRWLVLTAALALALTLVAPLNWLTPQAPDFYFGYLFPNAFHSPTNVLLRPLAVTLFFFCAATLRGTGAIGSPRRASGIVLLTVLCGLAKPNYLICLIPALVVTGVLPGARRQWPSVALSVIAPGLAVIAAQAWLTLTSPRLAPATVELAPFKVVFHYTRPSVALVAVKLILSALFPLAVVVAQGRAALRDAALRLAWLSFAFGTFYAYGLAETGRRLVDGNFLWSGQVSLLVLFVASARSLVASAANTSRPHSSVGTTSPGSGRETSRRRLAACGTALALHVLAGWSNAARFVATGDRYFLAG
jgi:hypothetical protein